MQSFSLKGRDREDGYSKRVQPEKARVQLEGYFELAPVKKNSVFTEKKGESSEYLHLVEQWTRVL